MTLQSWWLFVLMSFMVSATPGPNMLAVMTTSARTGFKSATAVMAGCMTALLAMMTVSAAGLGALLKAFPTVFDAMRLTGAAYLAWLGVQQWRAPVRPDEASPAPMGESAARQAASRLYTQGLLVAASNPKAIVFAAAFFPQFIQADQPALPQFAVLLSTFSVIEVSWYLVYAASGERLARRLRQATVMRWFNRVTGSVFVGFAALMADVRH